MFSLFQSFRQAEEAALAPLLELARSRQGAARAAFLNDLRVDAPTVAARLESLLAAEHALPTMEPAGTFPTRLPSVHLVEFTTA